MHNAQLMNIHKPQPPSPATMENISTEIFAICLISSITRDHLNNKKKNKKPRFQAER